MSNQPNQELSELKKTARKFADSGKPLSDRGAKTILRGLVQCGISANDMVKIFSNPRWTTESTFRSALSEFKISVPKKGYSYSDVQLAIIEECAKKSKDVTPETHRQFIEEMMDTVNTQRRKEGLGKTTYKLLRHMMRHRGIKWHADAARPRKGGKQVDEKARAKEQEKQAAEALNLAYASIRPYLKENGRIRNQKATQLMGLDKRASRDMLEKLTLTQNAKLLGVRNVRGEDGKQTTWYFSAEEGFYNLKTLLHVFPKDECRRIARDALQVIRGGGKHSVSRLGSQLYPGQVADNIIDVLLPHLLEESLDLDIIAIDSSGNYMRGAFAEFEDPETIRVIHRLGQIATDRPQNKRKDFETVADILTARRKSMAKIVTQPFEIGSLLPTKGPINIMFSSGMPEGHILADEEFFDRALTNLESHEELGPDLVVANNFVQGNFLFSDIMCGLMLDDLAGMDEIDPQIKAAGVWFNRLQRLPKNSALFINTSVDEKRTAKDYALKDMLKGKQWNKVFGLNLSPERQRFAKNQFFFQLFRFQAEVIVPYWIQMSRAPYNEAQMDTVAKERNLTPLGHSEKVALVNLYWAETFGSKEHYPHLSEKDQELVRKLRAKYEGWAHWTTQPDPRDKNFKELWKEYSRPVNLYALMGKEAAKFVKE